MPAPQASATPLMTPVQPSVCPALVQQLLRQYRQGGARQVRPPAQRPPKVAESARPGGCSRRPGAGPSRQTKQGAAALSQLPGPAQPPPGARLTSPSRTLHMARPCLLGLVLWPGHALACWDRHPAWGRMRSAQGALMTCRPAGGVMGCGLVLLSCKGLGVGRKTACGEFSRRAYALLVPDVPEQL